MVAPTNLSFEQPGTAPGTALAWVTNIQNAGVALADYRGSRPQPVAYEDFDYDWDNNQTWVDAIQTPSAALFDRPTRPAGLPYEDFSINWSNYPAMQAPPLTVDEWGAPATGFCNVYLLTIDLAEMGDFAAPDPPATSPLKDPQTRSYEGFDVGWLNGPPPDVPGSLPVALAGVAAGNPVVVTLADNHGVAAGQRFTVYLRGVDPGWGINGLWTTATATATSPTAFSLPVFRVSAPAPVSATAVVQSTFETNYRPPDWQPVTTYRAGSTVASQGSWWQSVGGGNPQWARSTPYVVGSMVDDVAGGGVWVALAVGQNGTTVAIGSNGVSLASFNGVGALAVVTTQGFATQGTLVFPNQGGAVVSYTGITEGSFTGCQIVSGSGTVSTGDPVAGSGISASTGSGPMGTGTFVDNPGPNQITWKFAVPDQGTSGAGSTGPIGTEPFQDNDIMWLPVRSVPTGPLYASVTGSYVEAAVAPASDGVALSTFTGAGTLFVDSLGGLGNLLPGSVSFPQHGDAVVTFTGTVETPPSLTGCILESGSGTLSTGDDVDLPYEDFSGEGWGVNEYVTAIQSASTAEYHGWDADTPPNPPFVANPSQAEESFFQVVNPAITVALVDLVTNLISLAPGKHLQDGARVIFVATPPYALYGSTYPSPIVPGVGYVTWNSSPHLGMDRLSVGDDNSAQFTRIEASSFSNPCQVTTQTPHGLSPGDIVFIFDHQVNTVINEFVGVDAVIDDYNFTIEEGAVAAGGATGQVYGPIHLVTFTTVGQAQLTITFNPTWDWPAPG